MGLSKRNDESKTGRRARVQGTGDSGVQGGSQLSPSISRQYNVGTLWGWKFPVAHLARPCTPR